MSSYCIFVTNLWEFNHISNQVLCLFSFRFIECCWKIKHNWLNREISFYSTHRKGSLLKYLSQLILHLHIFVFGSVYLNSFGSSKFSFAFMWRRNLYFHVKINTDCIKNEDEHQFPFFFLVLIVFCSISILNALCLQLCESVNWEEKKVEIPLMLDESCNHNQ